MTWQIFTVEDCFEIFDNRRIPLNQEDRDKIPGSIPYYGANGVQGYISKFIFDDDLILLAEDGGNFEAFATRPIAYRVKGKCWVNNHAHVLKAKVGFKQDALFYWLVHKNILGVISGGTRSKLNQVELKSIPFYLPPTEYQKQIADVLSTLDQAIEQTKTLIAKYQRVKTGLMQDLLTRGIDERGNLRDPATHEFKDSPLGKIPAEWEVITLEEIVGRSNSKIQTGPFGSQLHAEEYTSEGISVVMPQNIKADGNIDFANSAKISSQRATKLSRHSLLHNDVIFARRGDLSLCAVIKNNYAGICGTGCLLVRISQKEMVGDWLVLIYKSFPSQLQIMSKAVGSTMVNLNTALLKELLVVRPSIQEQKRIIATLAAASSNIETTQMFLNILSRTKSGLMQDLLTGKVSVEPLLTSEDTSPSSGGRSAAGYPAG